MAKLIQFSSEHARRRDLKRAGKQEILERSGQLNLFDARKQKSGDVQPILHFSNVFVKALYLDEMGHPQAEEAYLEAIEKQVRTADAWCNLAIIYASRAEDLKAIDALTTALTLAPRHALCHYNLANIYLDHGNLNLARLHYEIAREIDPEFPEVFFNLGLVYLIRGHRSKAVDMLQRYEELMPGGLDELSEYLKDMEG